VSTVTLHIGAFKTGTTFVQQVMSNNKSTLADHGVLWPGKVWREQVRGVKGILTGEAEAMADWQRIVNQIDSWEGDRAVVSMESLSLANSAAVERAVKSLHRHRVRVVLSTRDIARVFPAQWQESVQNKWSWSYQEYIDGVIGEKSRGKRARRHFWTKHEWAQILKTWGEQVPFEDLALVTVPPPGADRGLLWQRMCEALELDPGAYDSSTRANESLGAASAEVIRYVTAELNESKDNVFVGRAVKRALTKKILVSRKKDEPKLILPEQHHQWARRESDRLVNELGALGVRVIGDLGDLISTFDEGKGPVTSDPSALPTDELLRAAAHGLVGLSARMSKQMDDPEEGTVT